MARAYANILTAIWTDDDFLGLSAGAQRMYLLLLSQPDLNYAGLLVYRPRRWAKLARNTTVEQVESWLGELETEWFVAVDRDAEELLIRSLIRNDGIWRQPNVFRAACRGVAGTLSRTLRGILRAELERLPLSDLSDSVREKVEKELNPLLRALPEAVRKPFREPFAEPFREARSEPIPEGPGVGGRGSSRPSPTTSEPSLRSGSARNGASPRTSGALALADDPAPTTQTLIGGWIEACKKRPPDRVIGQASKEVKALLEEGIDPADIEAGLEHWRTRNLHPSTIPSVVNEVMNCEDQHDDPPPSAATQKATGWLALAEPQPGLRALPGGES